MKNLQKLSIALVLLFSATLFSQRSTFWDGTYKMDYGNQTMKIETQGGQYYKAYFTGDFYTVDHNAKKNIEYFESFIDEVEAIIIPEATCSAMIKIDYEHFFHDQPEWKARASKLKDKIFMATQWLQHHTHLEHLLASKERKTLNVTYHDPCHARKMQGIYQEPRNLVSQNYNLVEMSDSNQCCGFGGVTMQTEKYHFAKAAGRPKAAMIKNTQAEVVTAECSACRMQINNSLFDADVETIFKNPIELIAEALEDKTEVKT